MLSPARLAPERLVDRALDRVVRLGRRQDALDPREVDAGLEALELVVGDRLDQALVEQVAHHRRHAVVAQAAGVEAGRDELRAQRVHLDQRRQVAGVAEVVGEPAAGQRRAGGRLAGDHLDLGAAAQHRAEEREGDAGEVRAAAGAADHDVRIVAGLLELLDRLLADHGLVQSARG